MDMISPSYNKDRMRLGEHFPLDTPLSVIIDTSERCNFRCSYCFRSTPKDVNWGFAAKNNLMTMETFRRIVGQLAFFPRKIKSVSLSSHGEPLCNPDLASMARYLKETEAAERIEMHTNASLLTVERAEEIAQSGFSRIIVSLQGMDSAAYERVCGVRLDWEAFYNRLCILYARRTEGLEIHMKISEAALDKENFEAEKNRFYRLFEPISHSVSVEKVTPLWKGLQSGEKENVNKYGQDVGKVECCPILFYKIWVAPDGEIYPCTGLPAPMTLGNIDNVSLLEAWNGPQRRSFLERHLRETRSNYPACADCFVPINTVTMEEDRIDQYREKILERLEGNF